jgi:hypothetical protein
LHIYPEDAEGILGIEVILPLGEGDLVGKCQIISLPAVSAKGLVAAKDYLRDIRHALCSQRFQKPPRRMEKGQMTGSCSNASNKPGLLFSS